MDIRNRMADVVKLRCNACQDFLKLIIADNWQKAIYDKAKTEVETNSRYKENWIPVYQKMREVGIENYSIDDMDVPFISQVVHGCRLIAPTSDKTRKSIEQLNDDRKLTAHSGQNEESEELYLQGLLALCDLKNFIETIDRFETSIDDELRINFKRTYAKRIEELKYTLDEERFSLLQEEKNIASDIKKIMDCTDEKQRLSVWNKLHKLYIDRCWYLEKDDDRYYKFVVAASDARIREAHIFAAYHFLFIKKDYEESERRLYMLYESFDSLPAYEAKSIIDAINMVPRDNNLTEGMRNLVNLIIEQGYPIEKTENGRFLWPKKPAQNS